MSFPILLFAAGLGTRMGDLTRDRPKPLIPVAGAPLIDHALQLADAAGARPQVVNLHYKADQLRQHLAGRDVLFSDETDCLRETGGGLRHALPLLGPGPVMTLNTDAIWRGSNPLAQLARDWRDGMEALLLLVPKALVQGHKGKGDFTRSPDGRITRAPDAIYTGAQIIHGDALLGFDDDAFSLNLVWDRIAQRGGLYGTIYDGQWCDVGQPDSIPLAEAMLHV
jgi:MurNAc alpha-1-phosphate uridylyltransferase